MKPERKRSKLIEDTIDELEREGSLGLERSYVQHGNTTVFDHSRDVAYMSLYLADVFNLKADKGSLVRGALLHDYFLYDWHDKDKSHRLHGFRHPGIALKNAMRDYDLTKKEKDIIKKHMFPLTLVPPAYMESWIVCIADKICALYETLGHLSDRKEVMTDI